MEKKKAELIETALQRRAWVDKWYAEIMAKPKKGVSRRTIEGMKTLLLRDMHREMNAAAFEAGFTRK